MPDQPSPYRQPWEVPNEKSEAQVPKPFQPTNNQSSSSNPVSAPTKKSRRKLIWVLVVVFILALLVPTLFFLKGLIFPVEFPSQRIAQPEKFLITESKFYILDGGERRLDLLGTHTTPPLIWVFNVKTGELIEKLSLDDVKAKKLEDSLISLETVNKGTSEKRAKNRRNCLESYVLLNGSGNKVETYIIYGKNKEVVVYPRNNIGTFANLEKNKGYTHLIKLEDRPAGLFKYRNYIYVITKDTTRQQITLEKINISTKEKTTLITNNAKEAYFLCERNDQYIDLVSGKSIFRYDLDNEEYIFNVQYDNKYATDFYEIEENILLVYGSDGIKVIDKKESKIVKEIEGEIPPDLLNYDENYIIWYIDLFTFDNTVYLLNKEELSLIEFTGE